jgi:hypothetical protein
MANISKNEKGVALLLVMGVIAVLSFILFEFTFETKLNRLKVFNQEDRFQARLNAEAGLNFALAKLRLYQEGRNMLEKNEAKKNAFPPSQLESLLTETFMYPIPLSKKASIIQQNALKDFEKNSLIRGEFSVTISKLSGLLNPNSLRVIEKKNSQQNTNQDAAADNQSADNTDGNLDPNKNNSTGQDSTPKENKWETARNLFIKSLGQTITEKLEKDEDFHNKHANTRVETLINELAFYVNDSNKVSGQDFLDAKAKFSDSNITPKHAPMASLDELYLLPSWDDSLVDLLKDKMSVHELTSIPVNEMTNADLKILFPDVNEIQVEQFFKHRDGDPDKKIRPSKFKSADDFKSVIVNKIGIMNDAEYQKRMSELKNAGLIIDIAGKIYKINARGVFNNATYTIVAIVDLPVKETPVKPADKNNQANNTQTQNTDQNADQTSEQNPNDPPTDPNKKKEEPIELLQPRVVEIRVE